MQFAELRLTFVSSKKAQASRCDALVTPIGESELKRAIEYGMMCLFAAIARSWQIEDLQSSDSRL